MNYLRLTELSRARITAPFGFEEIKLSDERLIWNLVNILYLRLLFSFSFVNQKPPFVVFFREKHQISNLSPETQNLYNAVLTFFSGENEHSREQVEVHGPRLLRSYNGADCRPVLKSLFGVYDVDTPTSVYPATVDVLGSRLDPNFASNNLFIIQVFAQFMDDILQYPEIQTVRIQKWLYKNGKQFPLVQAFNQMLFSTRVGTQKSKLSALQEIVVFLESINSEFEKFCLTNHFQHPIVKILIALKEGLLTVNFQEQYVESFDESLKKETPQAKLQKINNLVRCFKGVFCDLPAFEMLEKSHPIYIKFDTSSNAANPLPLQTFFEFIIFLWSSQDTNDHYWGLIFLITTLTVARAGEFVSLKPEHVTFEIGYDLIKNKEYTKWVLSYERSKTQRNIKKGAVAMLPNHWLPLLKEKQRLLY